MRRRDLFALSALAAAADRLPVLRSKDLTVTLDPAAGGEIASIRHNGLELIYRALQPDPPKGWRGRAPWLWPAVGRNFAPGDKPDGGDNVTGSYVWDGKRLRMPIHGFVRTRPWTVASARGSKAELRLTVQADPAIYPWAAELTVRYRVESGKIRAIYEVAASKTNASPMPFSAGNHISFNYPLAADGGEMLWSTNSSTVIRKSPEGLPSGETQARRFWDPSPVSRVVREYPLSLGGYSAGEAWLRLTDARKRAITLRHSASSVPGEPSLRFNFWGTAECVSPEPWVGLQNSFNRKQGLVILEPGRSWRWDLLFEFAA